MKHIIKPLIKQVLILIILDNWVLQLPQRSVEFGGINGFLDTGRDTGSLLCWGEHFLKTMFFHVNKCFTDEVFSQLLSLHCYKKEVWLHEVTNKRAKEVGT